MNVQTSSWKFMRPPELLYYEMNSQDRRPGRTHLPAGSLHGEVSAFCIRLAISREAPTRKQCTYFTRGLWNCSRTDWACRATGYASTSKHLSQCTKTSELRDDLRGSRGSIGGFSNLVDECRRSVAQESRTLADVPDMCPILSGSNPISRAQVASAATGSSASTIFPRGRGVPLSGPFPSIATMPSAITKWIGTVAHRSRMLS